MQSGSQRDVCIPMFIAALFLIAKIWKQSKCLLMDEWIKKMWCIYNGILVSHKKEGNDAICDKMDEPGEHYAKRNKPYTEIQLMHDLIYMWNLKTLNSYNQRVE